METCVVKNLAEQSFDMLQQHRLACIAEYAAELEAGGRMTELVREAVQKAERLSGEFTTIVYIAGGLTGMSDEVKARYGLLSAVIAQIPGMFGYAPHLHGTDPIVHPHVEPEEVRDIDFLFAAVVPDYHFNCWHPIAHGNAVEAGWAELKGIPAIHFVPEGVTLSRLVRGMRNIAATITYADFQTDGLDKVRHFLADHKSVA